jgi:hypothetical protein
MESCAAAAAAAAVVIEAMHVAHLQMHRLQLNWMMRLLGMQQFARRVDLCCHQEPIVHG